MSFLTVWSYPCFVISPLPDCLIMLIGIHLVAECVNTMGEIYGNCLITAQLLFHKSHSHKVSGLCHLYPLAYLIKKISWWIPQLGHRSLYFWSISHSYIRFMCQTLKRGNAGTYPRNEMWMGSYSALKKKIWKLCCNWLQRATLMP